MSTQQDKSLIENNNKDEIMDVENIYNDIKEKILIARSKMLKHIDTLKTPYIFEFAGLKENKNYLETDLERALLSHSRYWSNANVCKLL